MPTIVTSLVNNSLFCCWETEKIPIPFNLPVILDGILLVKQEYDEYECAS